MLEARSLAWSAESGRGGATVAAAARSVKRERRANQSERVRSPFSGRYAFIYVEGVSGRLYKLSSSAQSTPTLVATFVCLQDYEVDVMPRQRARQHHGSVARAGHLGTAAPQADPPLPPPHGACSNGTAQNPARHTPRRLESTTLAQRLICSRRLPLKAYQRVWLHAKTLRSWRVYSSTAACRRSVPTAAFIARNRPRGASRAHG